MFRLWSFCVVEIQKCLCELIKLNSKLHKANPETIDFVKVSSLDCQVLLKIRIELSYIISYVNYAERTGFHEIQNY